MSIMELGTGKLRLALLQLSVSAIKSENLHRVSNFISEAASQGAKIISLGECFNSPYGNQHFPRYAETIPGETTEHLSLLAKQHQIYLVGGSIPEIANGKYYNSCAIFDPKGELIAKHRKVHLFDIDIPGKITVKESEILSAGNKLTTFDTPSCKVGIGICFDIRFPEMAQAYAKKGCKLIIYPGAFNLTTGPAHWELLQQARAVDNQLYVAAVSPARDENASYINWGHSTVVNPWGTVIGKMDHREGVLYADLDLDYVDEIRRQLPVTSGRRKDVNFSDETE